MITFIPGYDNAPNHLNSFHSMIRLKCQNMDDDNIPHADIDFVCDYPGSLDVVDKARKLFRSEDNLTIHDFEDFRTENLTGKNVIVISNRSFFVMPALAADIRVHVIGIGRHDYRKFKNMADKHNGTYNYLQNTDELPDAVGSAMGAIFSTFYRDISIKIKCNSLVFSGQDAKVKTKFSIGDLYADEQKDILIRCHRIKNELQHRIEYTMTAFSVMSGGDIEIQGVKVLNASSRYKINDQVEMRKDEMEAVQKLSEYNTDIKTKCGQLHEDIEMLRESQTPALFQRIIQEYKDQRDNRTDQYVSKYYTRFRLWLSTEINKS